MIDRPYDPADAVDPGARSFVEGFEAAWSRPTPEGFGHLFAPQVRLIAPLTPATNGRRQAVAGFTSLLGLLPDLTARVLDWVPTGDGVMIDLVFTATLGRRPVRWRGIDRFVLDDEGLVLERVHFADSTPLVRAAALTPSAWLRVLLSGARPARPMANSGFTGEQRGDDDAFELAGGTATVVRTGSRGDLVYKELVVEIPTKREPARFLAARTCRTAEAGMIATGLFYDPLAVRAMLWRNATTGRRLPRPATPAAVEHAAP